MIRKELTKDQEAWRANLHNIWWKKKKALGLTQAVAAKRCGWSSQATTGHYINGEIPLNFNAILQFANVLEVSIDAIAPDSDLTKAVAIAVKRQAAPKPETTTEDFRIMLSGLDAETKVGILRKFTESISEDDRAIVLRAIAEQL